MRDRRRKEVITAVLQMGADWTMDDLAYAGVRGHGGLRRELGRLVDEGFLETTSGRKGGKEVLFYAKTAEGYLGLRERLKELEQATA